MSETETKAPVEVLPEKPKRERKPKSEAIVVAEPEVRLGSLAINNPTDLVTRASDLATVLADIIKKRKLYSTISNREFVKCEGWTTMGAMLGVIPVEDYCRPLPNANGFEAKINLIRSRDGQMVGSASAECTRDENNWKKRDSYSLRSMALTRATGKAFRLSYSWIMQLAGFQPTPAEEMMSEEDASVERKAVEDEVEHQKANKGVPSGANGHSQPSNGASLFYALQPSGLYAVTGDAELMKRLYPQFSKQLHQDKSGNFYMLNENGLEVLKFQCEEGKIPLKVLQGPKA